MDIAGTFNHLIPSDQLEDSLLLGQNLECEASDEFTSGHNRPEDSLKNMLSDKDPMFGSASTQFHLLENDDANFQLPSATGGRNCCTLLNDGASRVLHMGLDLGQNQGFDVHSAPEVVEELNVGEHMANEIPMDFGPYVNPNDVQETNGALPFKPSSTEATADTKVSEESEAEKPSVCKSQNKNGTAEKPAARKQLKPKQPLSVTKDKHVQLAKPGVLQKGSKHLKQDKKEQKDTEESLQHAKGKPDSASLKRPAVSVTPKPASKLQKVQANHPVKQNANPAVPASPTINRKPSSDSSPGTKVVANKSPHSVKKPQIPPPAATKPSQPEKDSPVGEEQDRTKVKKPDKIMQRQRSRNSRSISVDEPELFIPDNAPVVKKGPAEGDPPPASENETTWDSSKQCGLCKKPHNNRFMVGCGRCDDWFHGDCVGLDLAKVQQMEKDDQEYVCLKCCAEEDGKSETQATDHSDNTSAQRQKQATEPSVTTGGIRPFRKVSKLPCLRVLYDKILATLFLSGSNVKHEFKKGKVSPASLKKPSTGQIRRSVRDSLEEILLKRLKDSDLKISTEKPAELARRTEKELFALFQGVDSKYKNKYRSLTFNLKDTKNNVLFKRVLKGEISPRDLVRMSAEELASKELAAWRQRENRHTIEMIEKEQREAERRPVTKITHKGEIEIENQEPAKAPEPIEPLEKAPDSKPESPKKIKDTTSLHKSHLFDLHCKICTGRMAPPAEEATTKVVKVATTVIRRQSTATEGDSQQITPISPPVAPSALVDDLSLRAMEEGLLNSSIFPAYESRSESVSSKEDTVAFLANLESLWNGYVDMPAVARFLTKAYPVSGILDHLNEDLPDSIQVGGRISPHIVWDYVEKIRASGTKEICVIRFTPDTEEDEISYTLLYAYFSSRRRYGVVANNRKQVKDMYLIPLGSSEKIPHQIVPFDGPGLETNRPNLLLGLIIRQRPKRDFGVILPSDASEAPSFLKENKPQVDPVQKTGTPRDEERNFISSLGRIHKKDTPSLIKSTAEEPLELEDDENVSLRFLPGVLTQPKSGKTVPAGDDVKDTISSTISQTSATESTTSGSVTPKTPTTPRLDRFIIKKKEPKPVKTEEEPSSSSAEMSSQGKEKESGGTSAVILSLKDKPGDVSTETFLSSLAAAQPKVESSSTETKSDSSERPSQETNLLPASSSTTSKDSTSDIPEVVSNNENILNPATTTK
uniref:PHD finger protein 3 n=1 Tax=Pygocentrus nattereri TaxID=42514 RepID=A0AAR2IVB7_PYGNA